MFFSHKHLEKRLRAEGREAKAEVLHCKTEGSESSFRALWADDDDLTTGSLLVRLKLRVKPDGEAPFEATVHAKVHGIIFQGDTVAVLYDPQDHSKVVVDSQAVLEEAKAASRPLDPELQALMDQEEAERSGQSKSL